MRKLISLFLTVTLLLTLVGSSFAGATGASSEPAKMFPEDLFASATNFGQYFKASVGEIPADAFETVSGEHIMTVKRPSGGADTGWYAYYTKNAISYDAYEITYDMMIVDAAVGNNAPAYVNLSADGSRPSGENYYKVGVKHAWAVSGYTTENEHTSPNEKSEIAKNASNQNLTFSNTEWIQVKVAVSEGTLKFYVNDKELTSVGRTEPGVLDGCFGLRYENVNWKIKNLQVTDKTPVTGTKISHVPADVLSSAEKFGEYFKSSVGEIPSDAFETVSGEHIMTVKRPSGGADTGWYVYYTKDALAYDEYEISYDMMIVDAAIGNNAPVYVNLNGDGSRPATENYYKVGVKHAWAVSGYTTQNEHTAPDEKSEIAKNASNQNLTFSNTEWINIKIEVSEDTMKVYVNGRELTTISRTETGALDGHFALRYENVAWKMKNLSIVGINEDVSGGNNQEGNDQTGGNNDQNGGNNQEENKPMGDASAALAGLVCASVVLLGVLVVTKVKKTVTE